MLTLLTYPAGMGQFSLSPFCVKAAALLQHAGLPWQRQDLNDPRKMPMQKLPVLRTPSGLIPDSDKIRDYLQSQGATFDDGLTDLERAQSQALIRMAEEHLYFHLVMDRWLNPEVWPTIRETYFHEVPALLRRPVTGAIRSGLRKGLMAQGLARYTEDERMARVEQDFGVLTTYLRDNLMLFGSDPSVADYSVFAVLAAMRATPVSTALSRRVAEDPVLSGYIDRMTDAVALP